MATSTYPPKSRVRLIKLAITILIALIAAVVTAYVKYGVEAGWPAVFNQLSQHPSRSTLGFLVLNLFAYDYVSIVSFMYGFEEVSDEIEWHAKGNPEEKIPRELKIVSYPFAVLACLMLI